MRSTRITMCEEFLSHGVICYRHKMILKVKKVKEDKNARRFFKWYDKFTYTLFTITHINEDVNIFICVEKIFSST